ncbi:unnamed protein product [Candidula unifasciata]|uniref:Uncharacterized protein n=1 Tax=Candidula unifasciata TaxID=100452 RepID=A0A8S3Z8G9_9EUPU|nr:unnamed protein product [Candidula unifasciata]
MVWIVVILIATVVAYLVLDRLIRLPKVSNFANKFVLITGCDSGFGRELAIRLDKMGFPVFAACLGQEGRRSLEENCSSRLVTLSLNVADTRSIQEAFKFVQQSLPNEKSLWAVVNNAGVGGTIGTMEMIPLESYISTCGINLFGPIEISRTFAPLLRKSQGRLVFMTSVMGRYPATPGPYSVSKFGIEAFGDVCRHDLSAFGIKVSMIEPGYFKTNILSPLLDGAKEAYAKTEQEVREAYGKDYLDQTAAGVGAMQVYASPDTHKVVDAYVSALTSVYPRPRYVVGTDAKLVYLPLAFLPEWIGDTLLASLKKRLSAKTTQIQ